MAEPPPLPRQATMGLLNYVTAHSLDEDYAHVSRTKPPTAARRPHGAGTLVGLLAFGLLVATAGAQTARTEPVRRDSHASLVAQVEQRREDLLAAREDVQRAERDVREARATLQQLSDDARTRQRRVRTLALLAGGSAATGPGVRVRVDDGTEAGERQLVLDTDLQILVNGLWTSGAEAIAVNGQRLTALTSIRVAGDAITVNLRSLSRPYVVTALGDPDQLPARFLDSAAGAWWLNLRSVYDLEFAMTTEESLTVPAAPSLALRHARPLGAPE